MIRWSPGNANKCPSGTGCSNIMADMRFYPKGAAKAGTKLRATTLFLQPRFRLNHCIRRFDAGAFHGAQRQRPGGDQEAGGLLRLRRAAVNRAAGGSTESMSGTRKAYTPPRSSSTRRIQSQTPRTHQQRPLYFPASFGMLRISTEDVNPSCQNHRP